MDTSPEHVEVVPIVVEEVTIEKKVVETGRVHVRTVVDEFEKTVSDTLSGSVVDVSRVPIGKFVDVAPQTEQRDDLTIIPVFEERLVIEKRLFLVEEVHLRRRTTLEPLSQTVTLRSTNAFVERLPPTSQSQN